MKKLIPMAVAGAFIATAAFASIQQQPATSVNTDKAVVDTLIPQTDQDNSQFPTTDQNTTQFPQADTTPVQTDTTQPTQEDTIQQNAAPQTDTTEAADTTSWK